MTTQDLQREILCLRLKIHQLEHSLRPLQVQYSRCEQDLAAYNEDYVRRLRHLIVDHEEDLFKLKGKLKFYTWGLENVFTLCNRLNVPKPVIL